MATDPDYAERYRRKRARASKRLNERRKSDPEYIRKRREYSKEYHQRPEVRQRLRRRYANSPELRERISCTNRRWREKNHDYDMLRKALDAMRGKTLEQREHERELAMARRKRMGKRRLARLKKHTSEMSCAWAKRQATDAEIGSAFRMRAKKPSDKVTAEQILDAQEFYARKMAERKHRRRRNRVYSLLKGCTEEQKRRLAKRYGDVGERGLVG